MWDSAAVRGPKWALWQTMMRQSGRPNERRSGTTGKRRRCAGGRPAADRRRCETAAPPRLAAAGAGDEAAGVARVGRIGYETAAAPGTVWRPPGRGADRRSAGPRCRLDRAAGMTRRRLTGFLV